MLRADDPDRDALAVAANSPESNERTFPVPMPQPIPVPEKDRSWLQFALMPSVVRRAAAYAVIVGAILITINHGDALLRRELGWGRILKMLLTVCVPYAVSTLSSVGALRSRG